MGLKTTNLKIEELGIELPEAYAIVNDLDIHGTSGTATLNISTSRENVFFKKPIKQVKVWVNAINRSEPLMPQIYAQAKRQVAVNKWDKDTGKTYTEMVDSYFTKWEDDIYEPVVEEYPPMNGIEYPTLEEGATE